MFRGLFKLFHLPIRFLSWLSDSLSRLGRGGERLAGSTVSSVSAADNLGRKFSGLFRWLFYPILSVVNWLDRVFQFKVGSKAVSSDDEQSAIEAKLRKKHQRQLMQERRRVSLPFRLGRMALSPFESALGFGWRLLRTRGRGIFWWSLPLIAISTVIGFAVYQTTYVDQTRLAVRYRQAVEEAIGNGDFATADLFQQKLEQLGVESDFGEYSTALALAEAGKRDEATRKMQAIASPDRPGHPGAHFWLAQELLNGKSPSLQIPLANEIALKHLQHLQTIAGDRPEIHFLRGVALVRQDRLEDAYLALGNSPRELFEAAGLKLVLALQLEKQGDLLTLATLVSRHVKERQAAGQSLAENQLPWLVEAEKILGNDAAAEEAVRKMLEQDPGNQDAIRYMEVFYENKVNSLLNQGKLEQARQVTLEWKELLPNNKAAEEATTRVDLAQLDQILEQRRFQAADIEMGITLIERIFQALPSNAWSVLGQRLQTVDTNRNADGIQPFYHAILESPQTPGKVLEFFGTQEATRQQWNQADQLLAKAVQRDPDLAAAWNNWGFVINTAFPERRPEAIECLNKALELAPERVDFWETRGSIYKSMEQWEKAISDWEIGLNATDKPVVRKQFHQQLAEAFTAIGEDQQAESHRKQADRL